MGLHTALGRAEGSVAASRAKNQRQKTFNESSCLPSECLCTDDQRIMKSFGLEETLKIIKFNYKPDTIINFLMFYYVLILTGTLKTVI